MAGLAELADASDLKSEVLIRRKGSTPLSRTIFDLGSNNTYRDSWLTWDWFPSEPVCKSDYLTCYNTHEIFNCKRKELLDQFMWTRRR